MTTLLENLIIRETEPIYSVLRQINLNGLGIVFVVDNHNHFVGVITDGDIRRGFLEKMQLDIEASKIANRNAVFGFDFEDENEWIRKIKEKSKKEEITTIPILDSNRTIVNMFSHKDGHFFPISAPLLKGNELKYIIDCVETNWISSQGNYIVDFENEFAKKYSVKHALTTMNGTVALHLALHAAGIGPGDEVLVPTLTFAASVNSIIYTGATPVLVDIDESTWGIDCNHAEKLITKKTKAIMPVHIYGQPCNMGEVMKLAEKHNLKIIEDCAEAQGAKWNSKFVGTMGDVGCFSFFANKIMTTGEGGMCITNDAALYQKMKMLRDHGIDRSKSGYFHALVGFNYRMTNLQAAIGLAQLERIDFLIERRHQIDQKYKNFVERYSQFEWQKDIPGFEKVCWLASTLFHGKKLNRDQLIQKLKEQAVDTRPFFVPMHQMEIYRQYANSQYPVADRVSLTGLNLPTSSNMTAEEQDILLSRLKQILETHES